MQWEGSILNNQTVLEEQQWKPEKRFGGRSNNEKWLQKDRAINGEIEFDEEVAFKQYWGNSNK